MVARSWASSATVLGPVRGLNGLGRHAADRFVDLMGLVHHGHRTCVWAERDRPPRPHDLFVVLVGLIRQADDRFVVLVGLVRHADDRFVVL